MRIGLLTDLDGQRAWHRWLAADLARSGHELVLLRPAVSERQVCPSGLRLALWLDPIWFRLKGEHAFDEIVTKRLAEVDAGTVRKSSPYDVLIDASSSAGLKPAADRVIRLEFNGVPSELAAVAAILSSEPVKFEIDDSLASKQETARPGIERRECLTLALDNLLSSVVNLLVDRIETGPKTTVAHAISSPACALLAVNETLRAHVSSPAGMRYIAGLVTARIARYLNRHTRKQRSWAIAMRGCSGPGLVGGAWPAVAAYDVITDDGQRYYADPFLFEHGGRSYLFAEELPLATRRGLISVAEIDARGVVSAFRPVLEREHHLSYPFVFAYGGDVWMIPEACESGAVELYRAVEFPDRWELDRSLLADVPGCDATIIPFGGRYHMILTATRWNGSTWDAQRVFQAETPLGPWHEQAGGLVRIDCTNARPAGAALVRNGRVLRPAQRSTKFYGGSMTLLEIQQLSTAGCREKPVATIKVAGPAGIIGTHTYTKSRAFEAVDVWGEVSEVKTVKVECAAIGDSVEQSSTMRSTRTTGPADISQLIVAVLLST